MLFSFPYYVSLHAVSRFRRRIAPLCTRDIRVEIQGQLQSDKQELLGFARWDRQVNPVYLGKFRDVKYLIPTQIDTNKSGELWPVVPTILPLKSINYIHWVKGEKGYQKWMETLERHILRQQSELGR